MKGENASVYRGAYVLYPIGLLRIGVLQHYKVQWLPLVLCNHQQPATSRARSSGQVQMLERKVKWTAGLRVKYCFEHARLYGRGQVEKNLDPSFGWLYRTNGPVLMDDGNLYTLVVWLKRIS